MKKLNAVFINFCLFLLIFAGCRMETDMEPVDTTTGAITTGIIASGAAATGDASLARPVAPLETWINAYSIITYFPGNSNVRDFTTYYSLYIYFAQPGYLYMYDLMSPYNLVSTAAVDVDFIDYAGGSWGLAGASNSSRRFYFNLMEPTYYYITYPSYLKEVYGFTVYMADNNYHIIVSAGINYNTSRFLIHYIYSNGILYMKANATILADDAMDITTIGSTIYGVNLSNYPLIWKKDSVASARVYEILPPGLNCHGYYSNFMYQNRVLYFKQPDYTYNAGYNAWGFYNLNYYSTITTVELTFIPLNGITF